MRLALNFPRVDPTRGGAETYVVDLCRSLVRAGPPGRPLCRVLEGGTLPPEVRCVAVAAHRAGPGTERIWSFARNSEAALAKADYDCTVGFINTWHHDVIIPQGGVHGGSLQANSRRFPSGLIRRLYVAGQDAQPQVLRLPGDRGGSMHRERQARVIAVSNMVRRHLQQFHHVPAAT